MPKLKIDGLEIEVPKGTKVIEAADRLGIVIPRFCFHPALGSVGACRMCAVMFGEGPVKGIQMSCMVDAQEGMVVSTHHPEAVAFRKQVVEWLMMNHPHDCPVCDEGGQCLLQDMTVAGGHGLRRYQGKKRTYRDQYLGPLVQHEMNRCIHCYRCSRFYQDFAGYRDLGPMQSSYRTYFGRYKDGPLDSPYSGNLVDVCPTGVYTDKPARFKGRRWDFERGPSLCIHCSLGCHTVGSARYREVTMMEGGFSEAVNGYFICDRGRFGFGYANHPERPRRARVGKKEVSWQEALETAADRLAVIRQSHGPESIASLGSCRSSLENQAMLKRLSHLQGWGGPGFFETPSMHAKVRKAVSRLDSRIAVSLREIERADFVLALGADPVNEAPMLALAMRQAFRHQASVVVMDPRPVFLPLEFEHLPLGPGEIYRYSGALIKKALDRSEITSLGQNALKFFDELPDEYPKGPFHDRLVEIEKKLKKSQKPVVVCGMDVALDFYPSLAADHALILKEAKGWAGLFYVLPGANAFGAALLSTEAGSLEEIVGEVEKGSIRALVVVENDPFRLYPDPQRLKAALTKLDFLLVMDYLPSQTLEMAHIFFPTATLFETGSSFVNQEGRLQFAQPFYAGGTPVEQIGRGGHPPRLFQADLPGGEPKPAWMILAELSEAVGKAGGKISPPQTIEDLWQWMAQENPAFAKVRIPYGQEELLEGVRLIPDRSRETPFTPPPSPSPSGGEGREGVTSLFPAESDEANSLTLHLVDWTFGTEELARYSPFVQQVEKNPCIFMQAKDASRLGLQDEDRVRVSLDGGSLEVELTVAQNMAPGIMFLPRHRQLEWRIFKELPAKIPIDGIKKMVTL